MKKISSLLILGVIALSINACTKSNSTNDVKSVKSNAAINFGTWHNNALNLYYNKYGKSLGSKDLQTIENELLSLLQKEDQSLFNSNNVTANIITQSVQRKKTIVVNSLSRHDEFQALIENLKTDGKISEALFSDLQGVLNNAFNANSTVTTLSLVDQLGAKQWDGTDKDYAATFVQVYKASYEYWNDKDASKSTNALKLDLVAPGGGVSCNETVIVADAAGALDGLIFGPAVSIIQGAAFSLIAANAPPCKPLPAALN